MAPSGPEWRDSSFPEPAAGGCPLTAKFAHCRCRPEAAAARVPRLFMVDPRRYPDRYRVARRRAQTSFGPLSWASALHAPKP